MGVRLEEPRRPGTSSPGGPEPLVVFPLDLICGRRCEVPGRLCAWPDAVLESSRRRRRSRGGASAEGRARCRGTRRRAWPFGGVFGPPHHHHCCTGEAAVSRSLLLAAATWVVAVAQFVPGFLVESGTDLQEWPKNLSSLFPENTSPEEQQDYYANAIASVFGSGTIAAPLPDHNPVEEVLDGRVEPNAAASEEIPGLQVLPNGTAVTASHGPHTPSTGSEADHDRCAMVLFSVARAHYKHRKGGTQGTQVLFDKVLSSVGPGFNHTGGYFKCECPGYYFFSINGVSPLQGRARLDLMRNRQRVASSEAQYYGFGTAANSAIIRVYKNDIVYVYLAEGFLYENDARFRGYASFSGFKIG
ncbi:complement C1q-like protein 2 [Penaeus japonicus]|uniref:complement C1q-like protein 2 n=1 Tax=Penaeus japonicus TaxID=27405 RepID=UPI001C717B37|nr:complement C1q-like protein 2 [Penaeus japonicus]